MSTWKQFWQKAVIFWPKYRRLIRYCNNKWRNVFCQSKWFAWHRFESWAPHTYQSFNETLTLIFPFDGHLTFLQRGQQRGKLPCLHCYHIFLIPVTYTSRSSFLFCSPQWWFLSLPRLCKSISVMRVQPSMGLWLVQSREYSAMEQNQVWSCRWFICQGVGLSLSLYLITHTHTDIFIHTGACIYTSTGIGNGSDPMRFTFNVSSRHTL